MAIVPITGFGQPWSSTDAAEAEAAISGTSERYAALMVVESDATSVLEAVGVAATRAGVRLILAPDATALIRELQARGDRLAFVRADDVTPEVRALGWQGRQLFGVDRVASLAEWPLRIRVPPDSSGASVSPAYDPAAAWTLVAGADVNLDGAVAHAVKVLGKGVDYPWDGGTAEITRRWCCTTYGQPMAEARRTGDRGAVRALLSGADLTIANFENPAPDDYTYHPGGFVFSADPALIEGVANAGVDWLSLANNHILDAGERGLLETMASLDAWGIRHGGAGANRAAAREPTLLEVRGRTVAFLAYDTFRPAYRATPTRAGTAWMTGSVVARDVARARQLGADLVIVFPHWGTEYEGRPTARQRRLARAAIDAGADLVLGSHPHRVGALEVYRGRPIFYSLGTLVFNIDRSRWTREGILVEHTFAGARLVQVRIHPLFVVGGVQPNLLDPAEDGREVLDDVQRASRGLASWW